MEGIARCSYKSKQGRLPAGTTLAPNSLTLNGTFGGKPGYLQFTVQIADAFGATTNVSPTFWMYDHISLAGDISTCFRIFTNCALSLPISGGVPGAKPSVTLVRAAPQAQGCWN